MFLRELAAKPAAQSERWVLISAGSKSPFAPSAKQHKCDDGDIAAMLARLAEHMSAYLHSPSMAVSAGSSRAGIGFAPNLLALGSAWLRNPQRSASIQFCTLGFLQPKNHPCLNPGTVRYPEGRTHMNDLDPFDNRAFDHSAMPEDMECSI
jgi:hypothetical protein